VAGIAAGAIALVLVSALSKVWRAMKGGVDSKKA
jgi:hypothetical protein